MSLLLSSSRTSLRVLRSAQRLSRFWKSVGEILRMTSLDCWQYSSKGILPAVQGSHTQDFAHRLPEPADKPFARRHEQADTLGNEFRLWRGVFARGFLGRCRVLAIGRMAVKLGILQCACAGVVENGKEAFVDVFTEARAAPLHLLVEDGTPQRANEDDDLHVRGVEAGGQQINGHSHARLGATDFLKVAFELVRVALRTSDASRVIVVAGNPAEFLGEKRGVRVIHAKDNDLLVEQSMLSELRVKVFSDELGAFRYANLALEVLLRVLSAIRSGEAVSVQIGDALLQEVRNKEPVLNGLLQRVGVNRVAEIVVGVAALFFGREFATFDFDDLARGGRETKLKRRAEVFQHAEPIAEAGTMAFVHDDEVEEVRLEMLEEFFAVEFLVKVLVIGKEDLPDAMLVLLDEGFVNEDARCSRKGTERAVGLVLQIVAVGQEKNTVVAKDVSGCI